MRHQTTVSLKAGKVQFFGFYCKVTDPLYKKELAAMLEEHVTERPLPKEIAARMEKYQRL